MPEPPGDSRRQGRGGRDLWPWAPWVVIAGALAVGFSVWTPVPPGIWHDDGVYVLLGRALAQGEGLRYVGVPGEPLAGKFPPIFPFLLSLVWRLFPSFPENVPVFGALNIVLTGVAAGVFYLLLLRVVRVRRSLAVSLTALAWVSAHLWRVASIPLSEPLFLLLLLAALWAGGRMEERPGSVGRVLAFVVLGGLAIYARTLGLAVLLAGAISLFLAGRRKGALGVAGGTVLLLLPWLAWTRHASASLPDPVRDTLGPYTSWLMAQALAHPGEFGEFLLRSLVSLAGRTATLLLPGLSGTWTFLGLFLLPVLILGFKWIFGRSRLVALTLLLVYGMVGVWPFQDVRLLVPVQCLLITCVGIGLLELVFEGSWSPGVRRGAAVVGLAWVFWFGGNSIVRLSRGWVSQPYRIRSAALLNAAEVVAARTLPDAVVGAPELWPGIHLYTHRSVTPSARFRPIAGEVPVEGSPEDQFELWDRMGVTHLLIEHGGRVHGAALDQLAAVCGPEMAQILDTRNGQLLVGLQWDEDCKTKLGVLDGEPEGGSATRGQNSMVPF